MYRVSLHPLQQHPRLPSRFPLSSKAFHNDPSIEDVLALTREYVRMIDSLYMIDLSANTFITPFALHLKNLIFRAKTGRSTKNPMTQAIKNNSPIVFDIAFYGE